MEEHILRKYIDERLSSRQIAKMEGISRASVRYWLNKYSLKTNHNTRTKNIGYTKEVFISSILIENNDRERVNGTNLKKLLFKFELKKNECERCGLKDEWMNEKICLQLDHINGNGWDNRIENLRILCPNCHSQTDTYCGKKRK